MATAVGALGWTPPRRLKSYGVGVLGAVTVGLVSVVFLTLFGLAGELVGVLFTTIFAVPSALGVYPGRDRARRVPLHRRLAPPCAT